MKNLAEKVLPCGHSITFGSCGAAGEPGQMTHQKTPQVVAAYDDLFHRLCSDFSPKDILEVGICRGGSLAIWREMFSSAKRIVGIDHDTDKLQPWTLDHFSETDAIRVIKAHMPDPSLDLGTFDLIVDDGDHGPESVFPTFDACWPMLRQGGLYVVEDWHQSFLRPHELILHFVDKLLGKDDSAEAGPLDAPVSIVAYRAFFVMRKP